MKTVQCYLCDGDAQFLFDSDKGKYINCPNCLYYRLTTGAMLYYFGKEDEGGLDREAKEKLIKYIKDNYDPKTGDATELNADIIKEVTGVVSIGHK